MSEIVIILLLILLSVGFSVGDYRRSRADRHYKAMSAMAANVRIEVPDSL